MTPARSFHLGTWLAIGSPVIAELASECGFDWVLFDLEHGCTPDAALPDQLRALRNSPTKAIVRVPSQHPDAIGRVLDWGAAGIMVPHVNTAEEAAACVSAMRYTPRGHRGLSRSARVYGYGLRSPSPAELQADPIFMAQIESLEGVHHAAEIAAVDGVSALFVGPADLQHDLRAHQEPSLPDFEHCLHLVLAAAKDAGKSAGILIREKSELQSHLRLGFTHIAIDSDVAILRKGYQDILKQAQ